MSKPRSISAFRLAMINLAAIVSIKNMPFIAEYGFGSVFLLCLAALTFFIPVALVSAELASVYPEAGGVRVWAKRAFGPKIGFLTIWLLWIENALWYPTILSFVASTLTYLIDPGLADHKFFVAFFILVIFWLFTWMNAKGMQLSSWISTFGFSIGTLIPALGIITLGILWYVKGHPIYIDLSFKGFIPSFHSSKDLVFFTGILLSLAGMEMSAVHIKDVQDPKKNYPKAIILSAIVVLFLLILSVLSIASVLPIQKIDLLTGPMQAFDLLLTTFHLRQFLPVMVILVALGALTTVSTWIAGPCKGLLSSADAGDLPEYFTKLNKQGMPKHLLTAQGIIVSIVALLFVFSPSVSSAFWMVTACVAQLYLIMYVIVFLSAIVLRYKDKDIQRPFAIPYKNIGMWAVASIGIITSVFAIFVGFLPPSQIDGLSQNRYVLYMILGIVICCSAPFLISLKKYRKH